jgi:hypothetical protein
MGAIATNCVFGLKTTNIEIYESQIKNLIALAIQRANVPTRILFTPPNSRCLVFFHNMQRLIKGTTKPNACC